MFILCVVTDFIQDLSEIDFIFETKLEYATGVQIRSIHEKTVVEFHAGVNLKLCRIQHFISAV